MVADYSDPAWLTRIEQMAERSRALEQEMNQPEVASNPARMVALTREHGQLERILRPFREYQQVRSQLAELAEILSDEDSDPELRELAKAELPELQRRRSELLNQLQEKLVTGDDAAIESVILEVRAGTGGDEAALFAAELVEMYKAYAARRGWKVEVLSVSATDLGGVREAILNIRGPEVYVDLKFEGGGHRVQRVPKTEAQGRIHTSAATVAVLPEPDQIDIEIDWDRDVIEHVSRAGGPGGQNVNKVASAIKLEHIPTGITVSMRDEKSQHKNRAKARRILLSRVYEHHQRQQQEQLARERRSMVGSGDRSERIRTYNFPQNRVTDHRVGLDIFDIEGVLVRGELEPFHKALRELEIRQKLEHMAGDE